VGGFTTFPRPIYQTTAGVATLKIDKEHPPLEWNLKYWSKRKADGSPRGQAEPIQAVLKPAMSDSGTRSWELQFLPPAGRAYILAEVYWSDQDACLPPPDLGNQSVAWTFHIRTAD
jgi:hypothetical protein